MALALSVWRATRTSSVCEPAEEQPRDVGRRDRAGARTELAQPRGRLRVADDERADERVVVAGQALRRRVEGDVASALERLHVQWGRGGRVADDGRRVCRRRLEVRHRQERVRRRLDPDEVGLGRRRPGLVELDVSHAPASRARRAALRFRSTHLPRGRPSVRVRAAPGRRPPTPRLPTRRAAPRRRRARRALARPRRPSGSRSALYENSPGSPSSYGHVVERSIGTEPPTLRL